MNRELIKFIAVVFMYILIGAFFGFSYNVFVDKFNILSFIKNILIWIFAYIFISIIFFFFK